MSGLSRLVALDQDALRCPAGIYEQLRARGVHYAPEVDAFVVARHDDAVTVLRERHVFSSRNAVGRIPPPLDPADPNPPLSPLLLMSDDPEHARRRSIVNRAFTPARIAVWELTTPVAALPYGPSFVNHGPVRLPARLTFREDRWQPRSDG